MAADVLEVILLLKNVQQFVAGAQEAAGAVGEVGVAAETTGKKAAGGWKGMVKWAAGAAVIYGGARYLKSAVDQTDQLAKSTVAFSKITGADTATSSEWVSLAKQRGVQARTLQMGLVKLSKTISDARGGTVAETKTVADLRKQIDQVAAAGGKTAPAQLAKLSKAIETAQGKGETARKTMLALGIGLDTVKNASTEKVLMRVADAFKTMKDPTERAALAQKVFGRAGIQMLPVLSQGAAGVQALLDKQKEAGNYLTSKGLAQVKQNIAQQRDLEDAMEGVKVQISLALMPVMIGLGKALVAVAKFVQPVTSNSQRLKVAIYLVVGALIAWKVAVIATTAVTKIQMAATKEWTAAQWLLNVALDANVIGLVVIAIAALVVGFVLAYKHVKVFRDVVDEAWTVLLRGAKFVWGWLKTHWPLLLGILTGPFGLAAVAIYENFDAIKKWVRNLITTIKGLFDGLVHYVEQIPHKLSKAIGKIPGGHAALKAAGFVGGALSHLATGGVVSKAGGFMVGERGPEILSLPAGAAVTPMSSPLAALTFGGGAGTGPIEVVVPVYLDGKQVARSVAKVTADRLARR